MSTALGDVRRLVALLALDAVGLDRMPATPDEERAYALAELATWVAVADLAPRQVSARKAALLDGGVPVEDVAAAGGVKPRSLKRRPPRRRESTS